MPAFLGQTDETDGLFTRVRLLDLIKEDKYSSCEKLLKTVTFKLKNSIGDAHTPQPREIVFNSMT